MQSEENETYGVYTYPYQPVSSAAVSVLEPPALTDTPAEPAIVEPPGSPPTPPQPPPGSPPTPQPPPRPRHRRRPGPAGAIVLLALALALIFSTGRYAGWESAHSSTGTATTSSATSSSATSLQAQQEAAIAKVEPSVVELIATTAQGEQIGSGVIIDAQGDIVTNNHVVSGEQSMSVVLSTGSTELPPLLWSRNILEYTILEGGAGSRKKFKRPTRRSLSARQ